MKNTLTVAVLQSHLIWESPIANRETFTIKLNKIKPSVDLIILPEMFTSGFTMNASYIAETMSGDTIAWMQRIAKTKQAAITGSLVIKENSKFYNRLVFVVPSGDIFYYDKRHSFSLAGEHKVYTSGQKRIIIDYLGWKICPLICYDLRFPVWSRNTVDYDLLLYVANWPEARISVWDTLLKARAIENMSYSIGVNRVGKDDNDHNYSGHSAVYDSVGNRLDLISKNEDTIALISLDYNNLQQNRAKFGFLKDRDSFILDSSS